LTRLTKSVLFGIARIERAASALRVASCRAALQGPFDRLGGQINFAARWWYFWVMCFTAAADSLDDCRRVHSARRGRSTGHHSPSWKNARTSRVMPAGLVPTHSLTGDRSPKQRCHGKRHHEERYAR
jgi:hypothetical protein